MKAETKQPKPKMGRPKFVIDYRVVEELAEIHCTQEEAAAVLGCSVKTLQRDDEFCRLHQKGLMVGKKSLRRLQWDAAKSGNTTMLVWLGKQYLEQRDYRTPDADPNQGREMIIDPNPPV